MKQNERFQPPRGIITPLVTPLNPDSTIDQAAIGALIEHVREGGVSGLMILGTTGEGPCLSMPQRLEVIASTCKPVRSQLPVFVAVTDPVFENSVELIRSAEQSHANAIVMTPPVYFTATQAETLDYFNALASSTSLPCFLYNIPSLTKTSIEPETILKAVETPNIVGLKESSADMMYLNVVKETLREHTEFSIYIGPEELLLQASCLGITGGVNGGSNLFPQLYVSLLEAIQEGNLNRAKKMHRIVTEISRTLYSISRNENACARVLKYALSKFGLCGETMVLPYHGLTQKERAAADRNLDYISRLLKQNGLPTSETLLLTRP